MDYYEELGITPSATAEEIGRAHRRLTKLLHPDQQMDEGMKSLAQTQMRRLNAMVETLSDPERRREYDEQLRGNLGAPAPRDLRTTVVRRPSVRRFTWHSVPWWVGSTIGAVVLTVGAVWFWADDLGSSFGSSRSQVYLRPQAQTATDSNAGSAPAITIQPTAPDHPTPLRRLSTRIRQAILPSKAPVKNVPARAQVPRIPQSRETVVVRPAPEPAAAIPSGQRPFRMPNSDITPGVPKQLDVPPPPKLALNNLRIEPPPVPLPAIPVAAIPKPSEPTAAPAVTANNVARTPKMNDQNPLAGDWIYAPKEPEKRKAGLYPPEFIELKLFSEAGVLHGEYRARYHVTDRPISPDVNFQLSPEDKTYRKFSWASNNGSRGIMKISPIDAGTIHVEWQTTRFIRGPALTAGTATLVRRSP